MILGSTQHTLVPVGMRSSGWGQGLPSEAHSLAGGQERVTSAETREDQHMVRRGKN